MEIPADQWSAVRAALADAGASFAELVSTVPPQRMATLDWTAAETAAHVASVATFYRTMLGAEEDTGRSAWRMEELLKANVDTVADLNAHVLRRFTERDPAVLAGQLRDDLDALLAVTGPMDPAMPVQWLGDARLPLAGLLAHLLNEIEVHGWDIATTAGLPWSVPPERAAMFLDLFLRGVTSLGYGRLLDHGQPPPRRRVAVRFRSRYTQPATYVIEDGRVTVQAPDSGDDVRIWFDPTAIVLMLFGRISKARAVFTGKVRVGGPRPWLLAPFMRTMHLPGRGDPAVVARRHQ